MRADSYRLSAGPLKAGTRVRIPLGAPLFRWSVRKLYGKMRPGIQNHNHSGRSHIRHAIYPAMTAGLCLVSRLILADAPARPCSPPRGASPFEVRMKCGAPDEIFTTRGSSPGWLHEEWRYSDIFVGLNDGRVEYVLK